MAMACMFTSCVQKMDQMTALAKALDTMWCKASAHRRAARDRSGAIGRTVHRMDAAVADNLGRSGPQIANSLKGIREAMARAGRQSPTRWQHSLGTCEQAWRSASIRMASGWRGLVGLANTTQQRSRPSAGSRELAPSCCFEPDRGGGRNFGALPPRAVERGRCPVRPPNRYFGKNEMVAHCRWIPAVEDRRGTGQARRRHVRRVGLLAPCLPTFAREPAPDYRCATGAASPKQGRAPCSIQQISRRGPAGGPRR